MARKIPADRFEQLVDTAVEVFIQRGYRLTQMADIARAMGVAKGTLYGYVESKEALFALCLFNADRQEPLVVPEVLPIPAPRPGKLGRDVRNLLSVEAVPAPLEEALTKERADDIRAEFEEIVRTFYETLERFCKSIKLIDRCMDHPELEGIWQVAGREAPRAALVEYLESRIAAGQLREVENVRIAARIIIETCTTWAVHIKWDRAPEPMDCIEAIEPVVGSLTTALLHGK